MPAQTKTEELLKRGIMPYLKAVRALREFRKEILSRSKSALKGRLSTVSAALRVKRLRPEDIRYQALPNLNPNAVTEEEGYADLCSRLELRSDCVLFVGLEWRQDAASGEVEPWAIASVWIPGARCDEYWEKLQPRYSDLHRVDTEIYLEEPCPPDQAGKLQAKLERLLDRWCVIWRKTGGIAAIPKRA
jgi:hypothetical protein